MAPAAGASWLGASPSGSRAPSPPPPLREPSILKPSASFKGNIKKHVSINEANHYLPPKSADPVSSISFKFENETEQNDQQITLRIDRNNSFKSNVDNRKNKQTSKTKPLLNVNTANQSAMYEQNSKHNNLKWQGSSDQPENDKELMQRFQIMQNPATNENIPSPSKVEIKPPIPKSHCEQKPAVTRRSKAIVHPRPSSLLVTKDDQSLLCARQPLAGRSRSVEDSTKVDSPAKKNLKYSNSIEKLGKLKHKLLFKSNNVTEKNLTSGIDNLESDDESTPLVSSDISSPSVSYKISDSKEKNNVPNIVSPSSTSSCSPPHQCHSVDDSPPRKLLQKNFGLECRQYSFPDIPLSTEVSPLSDTTKLQSPVSDGTDNYDKLDLLPHDKMADVKSAVMALQQSVDFRSSPSLRAAESEISLCNMLEPYNMQLLTPALSDASIRSGLWRQDALDDQEEWNNL